MRCSKGSPIGRPLYAARRARPAGWPLPRHFRLRASFCAHCGGDDGEAPARRLSRAPCRPGLCGPRAVASTAGAAWALAHYGEGGFVPLGARRRQSRLAGGGTADRRGGGSASRPPRPEADRAVDRQAARAACRPLRRRSGHPHRPGAGRLDEVLSPRRPAPRLSAERRFAEPVIDEASLLQTVTSLARRSCRHLSGKASARGFSKSRSSASTVRSSRAAIGTAAPLGARRRSGDAFFGTARSARLGVGRRLRLRHGPPCGASRRALHAAQIDLAGEARKAPGLVHLYDRLGARLGPRASPASPRRHAYPRARRPRPADDAFRLAA